VAFQKAFNRGQRQLSETCVHSVWEPLLAAAGVPVLCLFLKFWSLHFVLIVLVHLLVVVCVRASMICLLGCGDTETLFIFMSLLVHTFSKGTFNKGNVNNQTTVS
jgi:hypothetical protein